MESSNCIPSTLLTGVAGSIQVSRRGASPAPSGVGQSDHATQTVPQGTAAAARCQAAPRCGRSAALQPTRHEPPLAAEALARNVGVGGRRPAAQAVSQLQALPYRMDPNARDSEARVPSLVSTQMVHYLTYSRATAKLSSLRPSDVWMAPGR